MLAGVQILGAISSSLQTFNSLFIELSSDRLC